MSATTGEAGTPAPAGGMSWQLRVGSARLTPPRLLNSEQIHFESLPETYSEIYLNKPLGNTRRHRWPERNYYTLERPELGFKCQKEFVLLSRFTLLDSWSWNTSDPHLNRACAWHLRGSERHTRRWLLVLPLFYCLIWDFRRLLLNLDHNMQLYSHVFSGNFGLSWTIFHRTFPTIRCYKIDSAHIVQPALHNKMKITLKLILQNPFEAGQRGCASSSAVAKPQTHKMSLLKIDTHKSLRQHERLGRSQMVSGSDTEGRNLSPATTLKIWMLK